MSKAKQPAPKPKRPAASRTIPTTRQVKPTQKKSLIRRHSKPIRPKLLGSFRLFNRSLDILKRHWQLFTCIFVAYALLDLILVRGLSGGLNLNSIKTSIDQTSSSSTGISAGLTLFVYLLGNAGSSNSSSANAGVYQTILIIAVSLAVIWALRQVYNDTLIRMRDTFYRGMYPLVPFILVLIVIALQLLPLLIGGTLYSIVITNGIAVGFIQEAFWAILFVVLTIVSLYLVCSSVFALYIVTLPDMTPMKALRSARELVRYRRWIILRKLLFLPLALLIIAAISIVPLILLVTPIASWVFLLLSLLSLIFFHSYMYALYRELLHE